MSARPAFAGFSLVRRRPGMALGHMLLVGLVFALGVGAALWLDAHPEIFAADRSKPGWFWLLVGRTARLDLAILVGLLAFDAVLRGQIYRAVLRPRETGLASIRLGADELRLFVASLVLATVWAAALTATISLSIAVTAWADAKLGRSAAFAIEAASALLIGWLIAWMGVRLAFVGPLTFAERRVALWSAVPLSRPFWPRLRLGIGVWLMAGLLLALAEPLRVLALEAAFALRDGLAYGDPLETLARGPIAVLGGSGLAAVILYALASLVLRAPFAAAIVEGYPAGGPVQ